MNTTKLTMIAFVRNRVMFLYLGKSWVRLNLITMEYHTFGDTTNVLDMKLQASNLKSWLLENRETFEAIMKPGKSEPPHVRKTLPPAGTKRVSLRNGLDNIIKDLLKKKEASP
jgi:hypothetical protein